MTQVSEAIVTEAIYSDGVLKPVAPLALANDQRVKVTVQSLQPVEDDKRSAALEEMLRDMEESTLHLTGSLPSRDDLHDRI
jgi:predicted DNA-binding antitoxin AbrB/MazE fold protein